MKINPKKLTKVACEELLQTIIGKLDELDEEDVFGSEGWQHYFGLDG